VWPFSAKFNNFSFHKIDLADRERIGTVFRNGEFGPVVHLAAQAGVRYSLQNPHAYLDANLAGFLNVLEGCRHRKTGHLVFASSSSVYGANTRLPFSVHDNVDHPISLYAATKKANELMAHAYSHLYGLPATGLRFFTVYGPWGRPDMAMYIFAKAINEGQPIRLFNQGLMRRDFTYIDDVVEALERVIARVPAKGSLPPHGELDPASSIAPWRIYNIGNNRTVEVPRVVELLEKEFGRKAKIEADAGGRCAGNLCRHRSLPLRMEYETSLPGIGNITDNEHGTSVLPRMVYCFFLLRHVPGISWRKR
jgi:UDP-glucuronate 4-epimerase